MQSIQRAESGAFDDLIFHVVDDLQEFGLLARADAMPGDRVTEQLDGNAPVAVGDAQSAVRGLHVTPEVKRRAARELAKQVDDVLAKHSLRGVALPVKKA